MNDPKCTLEALYTTFRVKLKAFIASRTQDEELANDLVQETFVKIAQHCGNEGDCSHPKAYLYTAAKNVISDHFRSSDQKAVIRYQTAPDGTPLHDLPVEPDTSSQDQPLIDCLVVLIESLPMPYRQAVRLADVELLPQQEIAAQMNISLSGAKSRVQRGRERLRALIMALCAIEHDRYGKITSCDPH